MKRVFFITIAIFASLVATAEQRNAPKIVAGPYIQACSQSEFTVVWQTDSDALSWVEIAPDDGTHFYNCERKQFFQTIYGRRPIGKWHTVRITDLEPGTVYRYRVLHKGVVLNEGNRRVRYSEGKGSNVYKKEPYFVRTLDSDSDVTRFAVGNDYHDSPQTINALFSKEVISPATHDFVVFNGDMVSSFESEERLVTNVLAPSVANFASEVPLFFSRGNHETRGAWAINYYNYFPTTSAMPYYTFADGPAHFIVLDCGEDKPDNDIEYHDLVRYDDYRQQQAQWLKSVVESEQFKAAPVKIVIIHIPPKSNGWHGEAEVARLFAPILNSAGIDAMICAHIHKYRFTEAGDSASCCNFPVICNPNRSRMDVEVTKDKICYKIVDAEGKEIATNEIIIK
ncbi:MAG: metallophosphoesterase [Alistipes sp.]|nr:metallophosphoesterase [Alistipes sp.]